VRTAPFSSSIAACCVNEKLRIADDIEQDMRDLKLDLFLFFISVGICLRE